MASIFIDRCKNLIRMLPSHIGRELDDVIFETNSDHHQNEFDETTREKLILGHKWMCELADTFEEMSCREIFEFLRETIEFMKED